MRRDKDIKQVRWTSCTVDNEDYNRRPLNAYRCSYPRSNSFDESTEPEDGTVEDSDRELSEDKEGEYETVLSLEETGYRCANGEPLSKRTCQLIPERRNLRDQGGVFAH